MTSETFKRKRSLSVRTSTTRAAYTTRQPKPSLFRRKSASVRLSNATSTSFLQSSDLPTITNCDDDSAESSVESNRGRRSWKRRKVQGKEKDVPSSRVNWHLSRIAFHSLTTDVSLLTAIFRTHGISEILTTGHAVTLLEHTIGQLGKLDTITLYPLTPGTWFLLAVSRTTNNGMSGKYNKPPWDCGSSSDFPDDNDNKQYRSSDEDGDEEGSDDVRDKPLDFKAHTRWSVDDDDRLRSLKEAGNPWDLICKQFPGRSLGAVQIRWHTKLRRKP